MYCNPLNKEDQIGILVFFNWYFYEFQKQKHFHMKFHVPADFSQEKKKKHIEKGQL